ncbi:T9SS type A sorting domain-containing protein [Marinilabiliaceae bacterium ANBcel2]|nr:T9SS type A sorting domain-containing protein [Marinilabiliaceae bacterium ANBcel2]
MIKCFISALFIFLCFCILEVKAQSYGVEPVGAGSDNNPYKISTAANLVWISENSDVWDSYFVQTNDLSLYSTEYINDGKGWGSIGSKSNPFTGFYDGNGYVVRGLFIDRSGEDNQGFFGYIKDAVLDNIHLYDISVVGGGNTGGLVGSSSSSAILNSSSHGRVDGRGNNIGGLIGLNSEGGEIFYSYSIAEVSGYSYVGGFAGLNDQLSYIMNCYSSGLVNPDGEESRYLGGFAGGNRSLDGIVNCYSTSLMDDVIPDTGGFTAMGDDVINSYWNTNSSTIDYSIAGEAKSYAEMFARDNFVDWDFETVWSIKEDISYPYLQWQQEPYAHNVPHGNSLEVVTNLLDAATISYSHNRSFFLEGEMVKFTQKVNQGYDFISWKIGDKIVGVDNILEFEMPDSSVVITAYYDSEFAGGVGSRDNPWLIETARHLNNVRNYSVDITDDPNKGELFYFKQIADIDLDISPWNEDKGWEPIGSGNRAFSNVYDGNGYVISGLYIDRIDESNIGLFGRTHYLSDVTEIKNISIKNSRVTGNVNTGILVGNIISAEVINCSVNGFVTGGNSVGGLAGRAGFNSVIKNSFSIVEVEAMGEAVGAFAGRMDLSHVEHCYSNAVVSGLDYLGGFVGKIDDSIIENCYSAGEIFVDSNSSVAGGFLGSVNHGLISNCYTVVSVVEKDGAKGFAGEFDNVGIESSYWSSDISGVEDDSYAELLGADDMISMGSYSNWDFDKTWSIYDDESYPFLYIQEMAEPFNYPVRLVDISQNVSPEGSGIVNGAGEYLSGSVIELSAESSDDFFFVNWTNSQGEILSDKEAFFYVAGRDNEEITANFDIKTSVGEIIKESSADIEFLIYPLPVHTILNIDSGSFNLDYFRLLSINGAVVEQEVVNSNKISLNVEHIPRGIYLLQLFTEETLFVKKILIE